MTHLRTAFAAVAPVSTFLRLSRRAAAPCPAPRPTPSSARPRARMSSSPPAPAPAPAPAVAVSGVADAADGERKPPKKKKKKKSGDAGRREKKASHSPALVAALEKYECVVGVEVHVQLATRTKAYCACAASPVRTPNTHICPVCMGHPGALPVLNARAVELAAQAALALGCAVAPSSRFDRKNYFYPDTAKNFQITQQYFPLAAGGAVEIAARSVRVTRLHMEEDSAKMTHEGGSSGGLADSTHSLVDFNRAGVPLVEIVSEPDMRSGAEAAEYGQELQRILRYIKASDCNMQDGSLRCDVNVSIRPNGREQLGTKVEVKNLNSFSAVQRSVEFEVERQAGLLDAGDSVIQETRLWDEKTLATKLMRVKEEAADYRYFPEPDLPPLMLEAEKIAAWRDALPELPFEKRARFIADYDLSAYDAFFLADDVYVAEYFEAAVVAGADPKACANWIMGDMTKILNKEKLTIRDCKLTPPHLAEMITLIDKGTISGKIAKDLIVELVMEGGEPAAIVADRGLICITDAIEMSVVIVGVMDAHPNEVEAYRNGKTQLFGFFVGKVMAATQGRADPELANTLLKLNLEP